MFSHTLFHRNFLGGHVTPFTGKNTGTQGEEAACLDLQLYDRAGPTHCHQPPTLVLPLVLIRRANPVSRVKESAEMLGGPPSVPSTEGVAQPLCHQRKGQDLNAEVQVHIQGAFKGRWKNVRLGIKKRRKLQRALK